MSGNGKNPGFEEHGERSRRRKHGRTLKKTFGRNTLVVKVL